jgi:hypothetical protein
MTMIPDLDGCLLDYSVSYLYRRFAECKTYEHPSPMFAFCADTYVAPNNAAPSAIPNPPVLIVVIVAHKERYVSPVEWL